MAKMSAAPWSDRLNRRAQQSRALLSNSLASPLNMLEGTLLKIKKSKKRPYKNLIIFLKKRGRKSSDFKNHSSKRVYSSLMTQWYYRKLFRPDSRTGIKALVGDQISLDP